MARSHRPIAPGVPVHVIQRGNNRTATFRAAEDHRRYHETLCEESRRSGCAIHAYALMTNHVHLLVTPENDRALSRLMQAVGRRYVRYVNARYQRTGTLWEGRFKSALIQCERYLLTCSRYIELNPVRAQMVDQPEQYRWSSYRHNACGETDVLITPHMVYHTLGSSAAERQAAYRALFRNALEPRTVDLIRHATQRGDALGDAAFWEQIEATTERSVRRQRHGGDHRSAAFHASKKSHFSSALTP